MFLCVGVRQDRAVIFVCQFADPPPFIITTDVLPKKERSAPVYSGDQNERILERDKVNKSWATRKGLCVKETRTSFQTVRGISSIIPIWACSSSVTCSNWAEKKKKEKVEVENGCCLPSNPEIIAISGCPGARFHNFDGRFSSCRESEIRLHEPKCRSCPNEVLVFSFGDLPCQVFPT